MLGGTSKVAIKMHELSERLQVWKKEEKISKKDKLIMILNDYLLKKSENDFLLRGKNSIKKARKLIFNTYSS